MSAYVKTIMTQRSTIDFRIKSRSGAFYPSNFSHNDGTLKSGSGAQYKPRLLCSISKFKYKPSKLRWYI